MDDGQQLHPQLSGPSQQQGGASGHYDDQSQQHYDAGDGQPQYGQQEAGEHYGAGEQHQVGYGDEDPYAAHQPEPEEHYEEPVQPPVPAGPTAEEVEAMEAAHQQALADVRAQAAAEAAQEAAAHAEAAAAAAAQVVAAESEALLQAERDKHEQQLKMESKAREVSRHPKP